jgi:hypothetical protein
MAIAMPKSASTAIVPVAVISPKIYFIRQTRVMLDSDLARLYGVSTKNLNQAVKRNAARLPANFMFQLNAVEVASLKGQTGTSRSRDAHGGRRYGALRVHRARDRHAVEGAAQRSCCSQARVSAASDDATPEDLRRKIDEMERR